MGATMADALRLYVLWAPGAPGASAPGARLAQAFGAHLDAVGMVRDGVGLRIPVRQRSLPWRPDIDPVTPRTIDLSAARANIVIAVYDDVMAARPQWARYLSDLERVAATRADQDLLAMVLMTSDNLAPGAWENIEAIRAPAAADGAESDWASWSRRIMLNILALAIDHGTAPANRGPADSAPKKIMVFLSHAKADGENAATLIEGFRRLKPTQRVSSIDMFFDSSDTLAGARYDTQFRNAIEHGAFLALVTDTYHTRRWCQWELLLAKELQRPIVIWDRSQKGILRSFPYLGNVPVIRACGIETNQPPSDEEIELLLLALMLEALRIRVWKDFALARIATQPVTPTRGAVSLFARPPELADIAYNRRAKGALVIVYPDPPIGQDERDLLSAADPEVRLLSLSEFLQ